MGISGEYVCCGGGIHDIEIHKRLNGGIFRLPKSFLIGGETRDQEKIRRNEGLRGFFSF
jgi:hypothetical protein